MKRFSYSRYLKNKLETFVDFPTHDLDLSKYIPGKDGAVYDLYAISNHYGSMGGGHYTAYAKVLHFVTLFAHSKIYIESSCLIDANFLFCCRFLMIIAGITSTIVTSHLWVRMKSKLLQHMCCFTAESGEKMAMVL